MTAVKETYSYEDSYFLIGNPWLLIVALIIVLVFLYIFLRKRR
ncbi:LPXTG cell wall anchor domain-containing protein [Rossellomorea sp. LjRoot5]